MKQLSPKAHWPYKPHEPHWSYEPHEPHKSHEPHKPYAFSLYLFLFPYQLSIVRYSIATDGLSRSGSESMYK